MTPTSKASRGHGERITGTKNINLKDDMHFGMENFPKYIFSSIFTIILSFLICSILYIFIKHASH